ncbi:sulfite exporter TauE/SafE family protein [Octadecabacter sp. G9-8]|uniref:Probable membrane transporter protein n=1 Tax=Octadecabacter dasysiphoniae TaxID=2909341 RepID=A0ABS9CVW6_9RHOB|nr:sulfite exporter TauE/SafE family protein [Octadecabacter dasysiphoniae]MCF2871076.1 sulfite exporter TauE/SafE family protein [Octadecabacter dasysiphoniae]
MEWILATTDLTQNEFLVVGALAMLAGVVRGFSGFALSAMVMATAIVILPPVELIPMLWWLEMSASILMLKNGWAEADRPMTYGLVIAALIGWPLGLWLTVSIPVDASKTLALSIIVVLAASQLAKIRLDFLASKAGLYGTGIAAGFVSGVAHVGGMVVAFYVLAADKPAAVMRASLVLYLFLGSATSMIALLAFGVMDFSGASRGLVFAIPTMIGVFLGQQLFTERLAPYYRPFCLILLIGLALLGLIRTQLS